MSAGSDNRGLIAWFARNGVAANLLMASIIIAGGAMLYRGIPLEVFPEFDSQYLSVRVPYRGATPEEVEKSVVVPVEEAIADVEGIEEIRSTAGESSGTVRIKVDESYDRREVLDDVKARVDAMSVRRRSRSALTNRALAAASAASASNS